ncbi:MAG TPA: SCP2 sterol-binding domain-containing protein [Steroidobacteraceae bacterium]|nr:SCP2 sterol-binding domain-containing protein [Steroidobacteraceae bacterium]HNS26601.1 SCP2 sterol-binding domain-containing protein [Steroidobacteraceae bacterium]
MITSAVQQLLNRNLPRSPQARALCEELAGRRAALTIEGTGLRLVLASDGQRITLTHETRPEGEASPPADAEIGGTPLNLLALLGTDAEGVIRRGDVRIDGDAQLAQRFRELAHLLRPDIEEELSQLVGDAAAHGLARAAAGVLDFGRQVAATGSRNVAEYLAHEHADLVPRAEADAFFADVDRTREDVDRLAARIELLVRRDQP